MGIYNGFLPSFTGFYWVLLGFIGFHWAVLGSYGFYRVFTGFLPEIIGSYWVLLGFIGFHWAVLGSYGFLRGYYWVLYRVLLVFYRNHLGLSGCQWDRKRGRTVSLVATNIWEKKKERIAECRRNFVPSWAPFPFGLSSSSSSSYSSSSSSSFVFFYRVLSSRPRSIKGETRRRFYDTSDRRRQRS